MKSDISDKYIKIGTNCYSIEPATEKNSYYLVNIFTKEYVGIKHLELVNVRSMSRRPFSLSFTKDNKVIIQFKRGEKILSAAIRKDRCLLSQTEGFPFDCVTSDSVGNELLYKAIDSINSLNNEIHNIKNMLQYNFPPTNAPQAVGKLRRYQEECTNLLLEFNDICKELGASFWLTAGTLLGAVRHRGFIPWDDDMDICIMEDDFEKVKDYFIKHKKFISEESSKTTSTNYKGVFLIDWYPGSYKLKMLNNGEFTPFIDIFVNYNLPAGRTVSEQYQAIKKLKPALNEVLNKKGIEKYKDYLISEQKKITSPKKEEFIFWGLQFARMVRDPKNIQIFSSLADDIFPLAKLSFENHEFNVPKNYEKYLTNMYGDFYSYPQKLDPKHGFKPVTPCF